VSVSRVTEAATRWRWYGGRPLDPDAAVLDRWRAGDQVAGRELFARYFDQLYRFFANKCEETDELIQATFFAIVKSVDRFEGRSSFRTYLFAIARNELYRYLRERKRTAAFDPALSSIAELATSAGSQIARNQEQECLFAALRTLPVEQQSLVELHYWEELDALALAEIFELSATAVRKRLSRARAALREAMAARGGAPPAALQSDDALERWARGAATMPHMP